MSTGERFYVKSGKRFIIPSSDIFDSWKFPTLFECTGHELETQTEESGTLGFRPGTIVFSLYHMSYWYISDKGRHKIADPDVFRYSNVTRFNVPWVKRKDLELHEDLGVIE
jgi:hypothetical protein